ncbi:hypothetical protein ANO11243_014030 [Dothideomycetidae sp. 11243]|nr:hypothetical protein ANO11243_014030 [fungal sp. No.11243]
MRLGSCVLLMCGGELCKCRVVAFAGRTARASGRDNDGDSDSKTRHQPVGNKEAEGGAWAQPWCQKRVSPTFASISKHTRTDRHDSKSIRRSRFIEDESVGGSAPSIPRNASAFGNRGDDNNVPALSKLTRFVSSFNPLNAFRLFPGFEKHSREDSALRTYESGIEVDQFDSVSQFDPALRADSRGPSYQTHRPNNSFHRGPFSSLRKARSEVSLLARGRLSNTSLSPSKRFSTDSAQLPSSKDIKQQYKLRKRISDLESQLDTARRELQYSIRSASPADPGHYPESNAPILRHTKRSSFQPLLPSLPSERLLFPSMADSDNEPQQAANTEDGVNDSFDVPDEFLDPAPRSQFDWQKQVSLHLDDSDGTIARSFERLDRGTRRASVADPSSRISHINETLPESTEEFHHQNSTGGLNSALHTARVDSQQDLGAVLQSGLAAQAKRPSSSAVQPESTTPPKKAKAGRPGRKPKPKKRKNDDENAEYRPENDGAGSDDDVDRCTKKRRSSGATATARNKRKSASGATTAAVAEELTALPEIPAAQPATEGQIAPLEAIQEEAESPVSSERRAQAVQSEGGAPASSVTSSDPQSAGSATQRGSRRWDWPDFVF